MEQHVAASKSVLLDAVAFKGSNTAPYCLGRAQISVHTSGATSYGAGASGSRVARFEIAAQAGSMIDLQSLVLTGTVHNRSAAASPASEANAIQFLAPSLTGLMESARVLIGGVEVSSMDYLARTEHLLGQLEPIHVRKADYAAGFGLVPASKEDVEGNYRTQPILAGDSRDVACTFRSLGILQSTSYLPLSMCPGGTMVLEVTWASNQRDCCNTTSPYGSDWNVSNLVVHIDSLSMEASFLSSLSAHILGGHALQMQFPSLHTAYNSVLSGDSQITLSRAASRLNKVLLTFGADDGDYYKAQNTLYLPASQTMKARLVIGEKRYPATEDLTGLGLFYHRLRMMAEGTNITRESFANNSFVASFNLEAAEQVQHTGVSTNNAPLNIFIAGLYGASEPAASKAKALYTTTISDELLELTNRGVVVGN